MGTKFKLPVELDVPFFYPEGIVQWEDPVSLKVFQDTPFIYEARFYTGRSAIQPWENPEEVTPLLLQEWGTLKTSLTELFNSRDGVAIRLPMKRAIAFYIEFLHWTNGVPVRFPLNFITLKSKPVNCQERLDFITSRPALYHSFIQLSELFTEQEKRFVKNIALKNRMKTV